MAPNLYFAVSAQQNLAVTSTTKISLSLNSMAHCLSASNIFRGRIPGQAALQSQLPAGTSPLMRSRWQRRRRSPSLESGSPARTPLNSEALNSANACAHGNRTFQPNRIVTRIVLDPFDQDIGIDIAFDQLDSNQQTAFEKLSN